MGMSALPEGTQGVCLAFGTGRGDCSDGKQDGGEWKTSAKMCGQVEDGDDDERVTPRWREAQEGAYDDRGGRG